MKNYKAFTMTTDNKLSFVGRVWRADRDIALPLPSGKIVLKYSEIVYSFLSGKKKFICFSLIDN